MDLDAFLPLELLAQVYYHLLYVHSTSQQQDYFAIWLVSVSQNLQLALAFQLHQNAIISPWSVPLKLHALGIQSQPLVVP